MILIAFEAIQPFDVGLPGCGQRTRRHDAKFARHSMVSSSTISIRLRSFADLRARYLVGTPRAALRPSAYERLAGLNALRIGSDQEGMALVKSQGVVLNLNYRLNDSMRLISISDFDASHYALLPTIDCNGTPYAVCAIGYDSVSHSVNQDLRFDFSADKTTLIVDAYYGLDNIVSRNTPHFYDFLNDEFLALGNSLVSAGVFTPATNPFTKSYWNPPGIGLLSQTNPAAFPTGLDANQNYTQEHRSAAFYTEGSQELTSTLKLTLGARFTHDTFAYKDALTTFDDLTSAARAYPVSHYRDPATGKFAFCYHINVEGSYGGDYWLHTGPRTFGIEVFMKFGASTHDDWTRRWLTGSPGNGADL